MIIAGVDFMDATTATLKEVNTAMNVYGRRKSVRRKRTKQLIAILLAVSLITLATAKPYQEAKATGLGEAAAGAAGLASLSPQGRLLVLGTIVGLGVAITVVPSQFEDGKNEELKKFYNETGQKMKDDFVRYSTQALNNNVSAAEQERNNAAHARAVIDDWLESAGGGVIDTTSEAWRWFQDFVSDIRNAIGGSSAMPDTLGGYPLFQDGEFLVGRTENRENGTYYETVSVILEGATLANECATAVLCRNDQGFLQVRDYLTGEVLQGCVEIVKRKCIDYNYITGELKFEYNPSIVARNASLYKLWEVGNLWEYNIPMWGTTSTPAGTTDVPGVANPSDYVAVGSDLPYNRPEGAWDICDPNGKQGQVSIGADIPGKLGYDDWYDLLGGVATGDTTWEDVANASDVITIGSDLANDYSPSNAKDWSAYHDGSIVGYDVDAAGNVTVTFEDGTVISIPQEYVSGMEWVNEQDKAQELDKDTALPVSG